MAVLSHKQPQVRLGSTASLQVRLETKLTDTAKEIRGCLSHES